jgi:hypothetical protein
MNGIGILFTGPSINLEIASSPPSVQVLPAKARTARALEFAERLADAGYTYSQFDIFWSSDYANVRKTEQFKGYLRKMGFVDYWRVRGWPQYCNPTGGEDFACN